MARRKQHIFPAFYRTYLHRHNALYRPRIVHKIPITDKFGRHIASAPYLLSEYLGPAHYALGSYRWTVWTYADNGMHFVYLYGPEAKMLSAMLLLIRNKMDPTVKLEIIRQGENT